MANKVNKKIDKVIECLDSIELKESTYKNVPNEVFTARNEIDFDKINEMLGKDLSHCERTQLRTYLALKCLMEKNDESK